MLNLTMWFTTIDQQRQPRQESHLLVSRLSRQTAEGSHNDRDSLRKNCGYMQESGDC